MQKCSIGALGLAFLILGCSESGGDGSSVDWTKGRGSAACHDWQEGYCQLVKDCAGTAISTCADQVQTLACATDAVASNCAAQFAKGSCGSLNSGGGCSPLEVVDAAVAVHACNDYLTAVCTHNATCGSAVDVATCVATLQGSLSCAKAIGAKLNYETCMQEIGALSCSGTIPPGCTQLIYVSQ